MIAVVAVSVLFFADAVFVATAPGSETIVSGGLMSDGTTAETFASSSQADPPYEPRGTPLDACYRAYPGNICTRIRSITTCYVGVDGQDSEVVQRLRFRLPYIGGAPTPRDPIDQFLVTTFGPEPPTLDVSDLGVTGPWTEQTCEAALGAVLEAVSESRPDLVTCHRGVGWFECQALGSDAHQQLDHMLEYQSHLLTFIESQQSPSTSERNPPTMSLEEWERIQVGSTASEVFRIVGSQGTPIATCTGGCQRFDRIVLWEGEWLHRQSPTVTYKDEIVVEKSVKDTTTPYP